jgi:RNA polymerase sigma-70 factor (ECF subfamily)
VEHWGTAVACARPGDPAAFGQLVRRFQDMAVAYAYSMLGDFQLAEDAAQEAFVQADRDLPSLPVPRTFPSWLRTIVFRQSRRLVRRTQVLTVPYEQARDIASDEASPAAAAERPALHQRVLAAIQSLPEHEREVTALFYINGYSQAEVAQFLDVPVSTVEVSLGQ